MHVGVVTNAPFPDENMFAREQAGALIDLGCRVTVFARRDRDPAWPHPAGVGVIDVHWEEDPAGFRDAVDRADPDVLHVQQRRGCRAALLLDVPTVVEITSTSLRPFPLRHAALGLTMWELRGPHPVGTANRALIGRLRPADFHAPNGYSSWALEVARRRAADPPRQLLTVYQGTFNPLRRLDRMLEAFARVVRELPEARLVCIGGRVEEDHSPLREVVDRLEIGKNVDLRARSGPGLLVDSMAAAALTVSWIPSATGFQHQPPLKVLDAQAADVPVLATPTAAVKELLRAGGGAVAPAEPGSFAEAWTKMLTSGARSVARLRDREAFLHERSWRTIMERVWVPTYRTQLGLS